MDQVSVSTLSPQEDEFALLLAGEPSLYRMFLDPRRVDEIMALLDTPVPTRTLRRLDGFLRTVSLHEDKDRLVVKSPGHIFRMNRLSDAYPQSPLLFLVRDVESLFESNIRMWTEMARRHALWNVSEASIEAFVIRSLDAAADRFGAFAANSQMMSRAAVCTYDSLRAQPLETVSALLDQVGLRGAGQVGNARMEARMDRSYVPKSRGDGLPPAAQRMGRKLREAQAALIEAGTGAGVD